MSICGLRRLSIHYTPHPRAVLPLCFSAFAAPFRSRPFLPPHPRAIARTAAAPVFSTRRVTSLSFRFRRPVHHARGKRDVYPCEHGVDEQYARHREHRSAPRTARTASPAITVPPAPLPSFPRTCYLFVFPLPPPRSAPAFSTRRTARAAPERSATSPAFPRFVFAVIQ